MYKRMLAMLLSLLLVLSTLPFVASAATSEEKQRVAKEVSRDYYSSLRWSGRKDLAGYCGLMTSLQLYFMDINNGLYVYDGNRQFDYYSEMDRTTGGYAVKSYSAKQYTLEEALNAATQYGTRDVYNLLVGFQWTNTSAGAYYGHAVVIYAILDGIVYFTEGFFTSFGAAAGQCIQIPIAKFAEYYDDWTRFEGLVVFGNKDYLDECEEYACNMFAQATGQTGVLTLPASAEEPMLGSQVLRKVRTGERMLVTGLYRNPQDQYYYRVDDSGTVGYVAAEMLKPELFIWDSICLQDPKLPVKMAEGEDFPLAGKIYGYDSDALSVRMEIRDQELGPCWSRSLSKPSGQFDLYRDGFDKSLDLSSFSEGSYQLNILVTGRNYYVQDGKVTTKRQTVPLYSDTFYIGKFTGIRIEDQAILETTMMDGWFYRDGTLYCYENGKPVVGWICHDGVDYYLQQDGSITTGWTTVNGKLRLFSNTGAMQTGWVTTEKGTCYLLKNGTMAEGAHTVDGQQYTFSSAGWLLESNS